MGDVNKHREWESKLGGIGGVDSGDTMNAYAIRQKGSEFCPNCNNPLCPDCYNTNECCECGRQLR